MHLERHGNGEGAFDFSSVSGLFPEQWQALRLSPGNSTYIRPYGFVLWGYFGLGTNSWVDDFDGLLARARLLELKPGAPMSEARKLAAILVADVVGYSRLAGADEDRILARLRALRSDLIDPTIALHRGRIVKRTGDGSLIEFRSVVDAVRCAVEVQNGMLERNAGLPPERRSSFASAFILATWWRRPTAT